jgi:beta-lactamase regulating signal transducer with metallopeptidase domain
MGNQANLLQSLGWAVLNSLWQLALLWVIYKIITGLAKQARPAAKSVLASFLLFAGFAWFIYTFLSAFKSGNAENSFSSLLLTADSGNAVSAWLQRTLPVASVIYLVLLILPVLRFIRNYRYVQVIRRFGLSKLSADWRLFVRRTAAQMGIKKQVQTWVSELVSSPVTIGFWKPVILVPLAAINHLSPAQLEAVLLHELSHIRRYDYLVNLLINFVQTILYFNPFVKAFVKIVEREREKSCDEMVLQFQYDSHEYASALLTLEKASQLQRSFAIAANGKQNDLLHRIETIMGVEKKPVLSFNKIAGLFAGLLCIIGMNALLIITKPAAEKGYSSFMEMNSPVEMFASGNDTDHENIKEHPLQSIARALPYTSREELKESLADPEAAEGYPATIINPEIIQASLDLAAQQVQLLSKEKEVQIKEAIAASKRVLEEAEWKNVEKEIADVFSRKEKESLKSTYESALNKMDWKGWENKLRLAFDKVDWDKVNDQLSNAISMVRIDSLQRVYADALEKIDMARTEMAENKLSGIPDTDITLNELEQKRKDLQKLNGYLKGLRTKKIVRL